MLYIYIISVLSFIGEMSRDFQNGKIYKISNDFNDSIYIGSTCDTLDKRMIRHKLDKQKHPERLLYKLMNDIGFPRFRIELLENFPCSDKYELLQKEASYIRQCDKQNLLNMEIPNRTYKEWYNDNKEHKKNLSHEYYEKNKEVVLEKIKEYKEINKESIKIRRSEKYICECGSTILKDTLARHKRCQKHIDFISQR